MDEADSPSMTADNWMDLISDWLREYQAVLSDSDRSSIFRNLQDLDGMKCRVSNSDRWTAFVSGVSSIAPDGLPTWGERPGSYHA